MRFNDYINIIPKRAFYDGYIKDMVLSDHIQTISEKAFWRVPFQDLTIPSQVDIIEKDAFTSYENLRIEDSPNTLSANITCNNIKSLYLGRNLSQKVWVVNGTFYRNFKLELGTGITSIPDEFFYYFDIDSVAIPQNVTYIGHGAFSHADHIKVEDGNTILNMNCIFDQETKSGHDQPFKNVKTLYLGRNVSSNCAYSNRWQNSLSDLEKLESVVVGPGAKRISAYSFYNCPKLQNVSLAYSLENIGEYAFGECSSLRTLKIVDCKNIEPHCFDRCSGLTSVHIFGTTNVDGFNNCTNLYSLNIGNQNAKIQGGFGGCSKLTKIGVFSQSPPVCSNNAFEGVNKFSCRLYVPEGLEETYLKADGWKNFLFAENSDLQSFIVSTLSVPQFSETRKVVELTKDQFLRDVISDSEKNSISSLTIKGLICGSDIVFLNSMPQLKILDIKDCTISSGGDAYYKDGNVSGTDGYGSSSVYTVQYFTNYGSNTSTLIKGINNTPISIYYRYDLQMAKLNSQITTLILPSSMKEIGSNAIDGSNLSALYCYAAKPPVATSEAFGNTNKTTCVLYVPEGGKSIYANATGWKDFKNIIESASDNYISHQPTNEDRQVLLARQDDNAIYQWYKYIDKTDKVIDITSLLSSASGWEGDGNRWQSNMHDAETSAIMSYECDFNAGDVLSFDWSVSSEELFDQLQCYLNDELLLVASGEQSGSFSKTIESAVSGKLSFVYIKDNITNKGNDNALISNVKISSSLERTMQVPEAIIGETSNELNATSVAYGDKVFCIVTLGNGYKLKSNEFVLEYLNFIKSQPTPENLSVELDKPEKGATYQWYQEIETKSDSKIIIPISSGSYKWTESNGIWTSGNKSVGSSSSIMTATIDVESGDALSFDWNVSSESGYDYFYCTINGTQVLKKSGTGNGTYTKEFTTASKVTIEYKYTKDSGTNSGADCATVSNIKLTRPSGFSNVVESEITGANTSTLDEMLIEGDATVWCVVTLPNGRILVSDKVQYKYNYALHFKRTHSDILSRTTATVTISDLDAVEKAISDYMNLPEDAQMKLQEEKALLDALKAEIGALTFKDIHATILSKTTSTVTITDLEAINKALDDYNNLSDAAKAKLAAEKELLDNLKKKAEELKAEEEALKAEINNFKTTHAAILGKTISTVSEKDLDAINKALDDYAKLSDAAKDALSKEKALLDALKQKAQEMASSIDGISHKHSPARTYNLRGQRVDNSSRGIVIRNGKKVYVK